MRVALIGDVHANLPALEAVLEHAHRLRVDAIWNLGDTVGLGPFPEEVVCRLRDEDAVSILGDYDRKVLHMKGRKRKWQRSRKLEQWLALRWSYEHLSRECRDYLRTLPAERTLSMLKAQALLVHGSPGASADHLLPTTPLPRLKALAVRAGTLVVACGHVRQPFVRKAGGTWFVNPGSLGRPDDGDPRASYAVLELPHVPFLTVRITHYRVAYDVERTLAALRASHLPEALGQMLREGRDLQAVLPLLPPSTAADTEDVLAEEQQQHLRAVLSLARRCDYPEQHTHQVTRLALMLFDQLQPLHGLGAHERFVLRCGALLHDIGLIEGRDSHNQTAQRIILNTPLIDLEGRSRTMVALLARYHRGALPSEKHLHYAGLSGRDRRAVAMMAGILRVADGLDRTHRSVAREVACELPPGQIIIWFGVSTGPADEERQTAREKGRLLEQIFNRKLTVEWYPR